MRSTLCIYHAACTDGFAAAYAVWKALGDKVEFHAGTYGETPPDVAGRHVVLVDFSYKRPVLEMMGTQALSVVVLDHHKTAFEDLQGYPVPAFIPGDPIRPWAPIEALFDMNRSGAGIAWDFFHPGEVRPRLIDLVEVRDLWRKEDSRWEDARRAHAVISSYPAGIATFDTLVDAYNDPERFAVNTIVGDALLRQADRHVGEVIGVGRRPATIGGIPAVMVNCPPWMASDVGDRLGRDPNVRCVATYQDTKDWRLFSLRSREPDGIDVGALAKAFGGGGHKHSAGFRVARDHELARL